MARVSRAAFVAAFLSLFAALPASAVVCVDPDDADCEATIQAGVDAAVASEVVEVAPGLYAEAVSITTSIVLRGRKGVFIDPSGLAAPAITVAAADVVIDGIAIRNGDDHGILVSGVAGTRLDGVDILSPADVCVRLTGATPGVAISGSRLRSCGDEAVLSDDSDGLQLLGDTVEDCDGVHLIGDDVVAERNTFARSGGTCLEIDGDDALVTGNRFSLCDDGIDVTGDGASLTRNALADTDGTAIATDGDNPVLESNSISGAGEGASVRCVAACQDGLVERNRLGNVRGTGLRVETLDAGLLVGGNQVTQASGVGLLLDGVGVRAERNRVTGAGSSCLRVTGDDNTVVSNGLADCAGDAIRVTGGGNSIESNRGAGIGGDGIDVEDGSGNDLLENQVSSAADNGIEVSPDADGTTVSGNRTSGFHADYCDGGATTGGSDVPDDTSGCGDID